MVQCKLIHCAGKIAVFSSRSICTDPVSSHCCPMSERRLTHEAITSIVGVCDDVQAQTTLHGFAGDLL
jgi:hypothetical protein